MAIIDITPALTKSVEGKYKAARRGAKRKVVAALGDFSRLQHLPDSVSSQFISEYVDTLDEVLLPYVTARVMTLQQATDYRSVLTDMIFGNEVHVGMYGYISELDTAGYTPAEVVGKVEELIVAGWRVNEYDGRWHLVSDLGARVMDVTGPSVYRDYTAASGIDDQSAHVFFPEDVAAKVSVAAKRIGQDADELARYGHLDLLVGEINDDILAGYVINYGRLRDVLRKNASYNALSGTKDITELYKEGFRLGSRIIASGAAVLEKGGVEYAVLPVEEKTQFGLNVYMLAQVVYSAKKRLVPRLVVPEVVEISDLGKVFAVMSEIFPDDYSSATFVDNYDYISNEQVRKELAQLAAVEVALFGNGDFNDGSFVYNGISNRLFSHHHLNYFTKPFSLVKSSGEFTGTFTDEDISVLLREVPDGFMTRVSGYELPLGKYPYDFSKIIEWFDEAREIF